MTHPRRHHGILFSNHDPGQRIGEWPAILFNLLDDSFRPIRAGPSSQKRTNCILCDWRIRAWCIPDQRKHRIEPAATPAPCRQPVKGKKQFGILPLEPLKSLNLVSQDIENELGIAEGVTDAFGLQSAIEIVLDQAMVRVAREGERVQPQRVDHLLGENPQSRSFVLKMGQVEVN